MKGYLDNPEATAATIKPGGWLHTGDIAVYDKDESIFIVDRLKELIKVKGFQVINSTNVACSKMSSGPLMKVEGKTL